MPQRRLSPLYSFAVAGLLLLGLGFLAYSFFRLDYEWDFLVLEPLTRQIPFSLIVVIQRLEDHPRTSSLSHAGMFTTPFSKRARKKRGLGSAELL